MDHRPIYNALDKSYAKMLRLRRLLNLIFPLQHCITYSDLPASNDIDFRAFSRIEKRVIRVLARCPCLFDEAGILFRAGKEFSRPRDKDPQLCLSSGQSSDQAGPSTGETGETADEPSRKDTGERTFTCFQRLPPEIRLMIWQAFANPPTCRKFLNKYELAERENQPINSLLEDNALWYVCHESRFAIELAYKTARKRAKRLHTCHTENENFALAKHYCRLGRFNESLKEVRYDTIRAEKLFRRLAYRCFYVPPPLRRLFETEMDTLNPHVEHYLSVTDAVAWGMGWPVPWPIIDQETIMSSATREDE